MGTDQEPTLFDEPDGRMLARRGDPESSKRAAAAIVPKLSRLQLWAARCVAESPGLSGAELGRRYCPEDVRKINRRLCECERAGLIRRVANGRQCTVSGRTVDAWYPGSSHG